MQCCNRMQIVSYHSLVGRVQSIPSNHPLLVALPWSLKLKCPGVDVPVISGYQFLSENGHVVYVSEEGAHQVTQHLTFIKGGTVGGLVGGWWGEVVFSSIAREHRSKCPRNEIFRSV